MENKELFAPILQEDEEIIKVMKPNKTRYIYLSGLAYTLFALIPILFMAVPIGMAIESFAEYGTPVPLVIELTVFGGLLLLGIITTWVGPVLYTRNGRTAAYAFRSIDHPYEVYRDLKHMVDEYKAAKAKQD